jgi:hypothetical protein
MVLDPEKENIAKHIFDKWDLDFAIVGETISDDRFLIKLDGVVKADLPLKALAGNAPEYDRPWSEGPPVEELKDVVEINAIDGLKALISSANYSSKSWIYEQYDSQVMADEIKAFKPSIAFISTTSFNSSTGGPSLHGRSYSGAFPANAFKGRSALTTPSSFIRNLSSEIVSPTIAKSKSHLSKICFAMFSFSGSKTISIQTQLSDSIIS